MNSYENSYENRILEIQESIEGDCKNCPYKEKCKNQCMKIETIYNPVIANIIGK